jgi:methyltransferase-like protein 6
MEDSGGCGDSLNEASSPSDDTGNSSSPPFQGTSHTTRELTDDELEKLSRQDKKLVSEFEQNKLEKEAQKNWDLFYKRNTTKFYKDRHWTTREFEELNCEKVTVQM